MSIVETFTSGSTKGQKDYHIFISYRVATDSALAERLCDKLQQLDVEREQDLRIKCFLDKQDLKVGENWERGFLRGLTGSCLFVVLLSEAALQYIVELKEGVKDNCLLEYETALKMQQRDAIDILPIFVGSTQSGTYRKFNGFGFNFPNVPSATQPTGTIKDTIQALFKLQGIFLNPDELKDKLGAIQSRLSISVWPRFREQWAYQETLGPERKYTCVQCGEEYQETKNGEGCCLYHARGDTSRNGTYLCCSKPGGSPGCLRAKHHNKHHMEFRYESWFKWAYSLLNYVDTLEDWAKLENENLLTKQIMFIRVGKVIKGNDNGKLFINMKVGSAESIWFKIYGKQEIAEVESLVGALALRAIDRGETEAITSIDGGKLTTSDGTVEFTWNISSSQGTSLTDFAVTGITVKSTSATSQPAVSILHLKFDDNGNAELVSEEVVSKAGLDEAVPASPYVFPKTQFMKGDVIKEAAVRKPQTDFAGYGSLKARVKLITTYCSQNDGRFNVAVTFINTNKTESVTLIEGGAVWTQPPVNANDASSTAPPWRDNEELKITLCNDKGDPSNGSLPQKVGPGDSLNVLFVIKLPKDPLIQSSMRNWSALARHGPLLFRVHLESMDGDKIYLPAEFINWSPYWSREQNEDEIIVFVDDIKRFTRSNVKVKFDLNQYNGSIMEIRVSTSPGSSRIYTVSTTNLRSIVYHAANNLKLKVSEGDDMKNGQETPATKLMNELQLEKQPGLGTYVRYPDLCLTATVAQQEVNYVEVGFLVDLACQRVAAAVIVLVGQSSSAVRFLPIPFYGLTSKVVNSPNFTKEPTLPKDLFALSNEFESLPVRPIGPIPWLQAEALSFSASPSPPSSSAGGVAASVDITAQLTPFFDKVFARFSTIDESLVRIEQRLTQLEANSKDAANANQGSSVAPASPPTGRTATGAAATAQFVTNANPPGSVEKKGWGFRKN